jgi:hypothetical protein
MKLGTAPAIIGPAADARTAICDALQAVDQLTVTRAAPDNPVAFCAWPKWSTSGFVGGRLAHPAIHEYDVIVTLPAGYEPETVEAGDSLLDQVVTALWEIGEVTTALPIQVAFDQARAQTMPAFQVHVIPDTC